MAPGARAAAQFCGRGRALDQGPQINFDHHALLSQKLIGRVVALQQMPGHAILDQVLHHHPDFPRQQCPRPLFNHMLRQHLGTKNVLLVQLGDCLQILHAQPQVIELPARKIQHAQRQPRGEDFVLHHLVAHQLEFMALAESGWRRAGRNGLRLGPGAAGAPDPRRAAFLEGLPGIASLLHFTCPAGLTLQRRQPALNRFGQLGQDPYGTLREHRTCLLGQKTVLFVSWNHDHPE